MFANHKQSKKTTNYEVSDTSVRSLSGFILSTPERSTAKSLNITFIRVNVTPEKNKEKRIYREVPKVRENQCINIRELQKSSDRK